MTSFVHVHASSTSSALCKTIGFLCQYSRVCVHESLYRTIRFRHVGFFNLNSNFNPDFNKNSKGRTDLKSDYV